ncbi:hypothetical protein GGR54DRAFT_541686 [Hypoxylon sp. NC1633]|nr:hypothetical protein GGR54DRAFT_541686 [Hypoxylon sp. NC1633]
MGGRIGGILAVEQSRKRGTYIGAAYEYTNCFMYFIRNCLMICFASFPYARLFTTPFPSPDSPSWSLPGKCKPRLLIVMLVSSLCMYGILQAQAQAQAKI